MGLDLCCRLQGQQKGMQESKLFGLVDYVRDITAERSVGMANMDCFSICSSYFSLRKYFISLVMSFTELHTCWPLTDIAYEDLEGSVLGGFLRESITTDDIAGRFVQQYLADLLHVHFRLTLQEHEVSDHVSFCLCDRIKHVCSQFI